MAIPDFQAMLLPLLQYAADGQEHSLRESIENLAAVFQLTDEERHHLLPSGQQPTFDNRVGWTCTHLKKAKLLTSTRRGYFQITERGYDLMREHPVSLNTKFLERFEEYNQFKTIKRNTLNSGNRSGEIILENDDDRTPEESLELAYEKVRNNLMEEVLDLVKNCSPTFFETLVIDLLLKMGYGGSRKEAGNRVGRSGDGGIDGIIKEDRLGLDVIYVQAKRWEGTVGRPEIQKFVGALAGQQAKKGIFITTSQFTREAVDYVNKIDSKIILIDGLMLSDFLIDYNVGISPVKTYEIKKVDTDYFMG